MTEKSEPGSRGAWGKDLGPSAWISLGSLGTAQVLWVLVSTVGLFENSVGSLGPLKTLRQRCFPPPNICATPSPKSHTHDCRAGLCLEPAWPVSCMCTHFPSWHSTSGSDFALAVASLEGKRGSVGLWEVQFPRWATRRRET